MTEYILPFKPGSEVVELGGGARPAFHPNVDTREMPEVDIVTDLNKHLPIEDSKFDGVFAHYLLEHVSWRNVESLLSECLRILRPGGVAVFFTADVRAQAQTLIDKARWDYRESQLLFGDQDYPENSHRVALDPNYATQLLAKIGFDPVEIHRHPDTHTDMIIQAHKPGVVTEELSVSGLKLNLGSFMDLLGDGWKNIDVLPLNPHIPEGIDFTSRDLTRGIPFESGSASLINCSHLIEHISLNQAHTLLAECHRALGDGGILRVSTPDFAKLAQAYLEDTLDQFEHDQPVEFTQAPTKGEKLARLLFTGHVWTYDAETLCLYLEQVGFAGVRVTSPGESLSKVIEREVKDTHPEVSLIVEGTKRL